jgi:hypothetical protein
VRITVHATRTSGTAMWGYGIGGKSSAGYLTAGSHTGSWLHCAGNPAAVLVTVGLEKYSSLYVDKFTVTYEYLTLQ